VTRCRRAGIWGAAYPIISQTTEYLTQVPEEQLPFLYNGTVDKTPATIGAGSSHTTELLEKVFTIHFERRLYEESSQSHRHREDHKTVRYNQYTENPRREHTENSSV
jgi:hypothetical protein